jgi:hypothetical protein
LAAAGQRIYCWGRPRTRYPGKTPEALATGLYGVLGKKYTNDTFYGNKHIQIMCFLPRASAKMEFVQAFNDLWWARAGKGWSGCGCASTARTSTTPTPSRSSRTPHSLPELKRGDKVTVVFSGWEPGVGLVVKKPAGEPVVPSVIFSGWRID